MRFVISEDLYNELAEKYFIEKSSHRTERIRKLVQVHRNKGKDYQAYRWVKVIEGKAARIDKKYNSIDAFAKIQYNQKHIVSKDFRDLSPEEVKEFINRAKNEYYYYNRSGIHIAYGNELAKDKEKFNKELADCKILVDAGHDVYWLPEYYAKDERGNKIHGDTITDNSALELKDTERNIKGNYKDGRKQATDLFIRVTASMTTSYAMESINKYINVVNRDKNVSMDFQGKLYLYFEKTKQLRLFEFNKNGEWKESNPQKK